MSPLVSVIVPVYNVRQYLKQCVESLTKQTYHNLEILLIDDGSTDGSSDICDKFAEQVENIVVYHKKNTGLGLSRNYGIAKAKGEYVTFVDSDDYIESNALKELVNGLENGINDTVIGGFTKVTNEGEKKYVEQYKIVSEKRPNIYKNICAKMLGSSPDKSDAIKPSVWNVLYSMDLIRKWDLRFPSERDLVSEDIVWDTDYFRYSQSVKIIDSTMYNYRSNPKSLTKTYNPRRWNKSIYFYEYMIRKMKKTKIARDAQLRLTKNLFIVTRCCISQESTQPLGKAYFNIMNICNDEVLGKAINEYPVYKLGCKQKFFIYTIQRKWGFLLMLMSKVGLI